jgi:hypothetical protein
MRPALLLASLTILGACAARQLSLNTVNVAGTIETIERQQTMGNFGRFADNDYAVPSVAFLTAGTVQIMNSVTPSVTFPLSSMFASAITTSATPSIANTTTSAGSAATIGASIAWQDNFNILPLTDSFTLRNIAVLYRAVMNVKRFGIAYSDGLPTYQVPRAYGRQDQLVPDPYYLSYSNCIFCLKRGASPPQDDQSLLKNLGKDIIVNDVVSYQWLYYKPLGSSNDSMRPEQVDMSELKWAGISNGYSFYIRKEVKTDKTNASGDKIKVSGDKMLSDFIILTLPIANEPTRFASLTAPPKKKPSRNRATGQVQPEEAIPNLNNNAEGMRLNFPAPFPVPGIQP